MRKRTLSLEKYVLRFLSFRPRSQYEVEKRLQQKGFDEKDIEKTVSRLKSNGLLNDREFTQSWIANREILRPEGKRLLRLELKNKGIENEIIDEALSSYDDETELILAKKALESKVRSYQDLPFQERRVKEFNFLSRRGFPYNISKKAVEKIKK